MKNQIVYFTSAFVIASAIFSCSKSDPAPTPATQPILTTSAVIGITATSAIGGGEVTSDGGGPVTARGVCWSTGATPSIPTVSDNKSTDGTGAGLFSSSITGLTAGNTYFVRAYATNTAGTGYGAVVSFVTPKEPVLTTALVTAITPTAATGGGEVISDGGSAVTARGICWSTSATPTLSDSKTVDGSGTGSFTSNITGLTTATTYFVRAYATNTVGTGYGSVLSFSTPKAPVITTSLVTGITAATATSGGEVTSDGGSAVTARGVCWSLSPAPTLSDSKTIDGTGAGIFTSSLTGLAAGTTYFVRAYATNLVGTSYGTETSFTTSQLIKNGSFENLATSSTLTDWFNVPATGVMTDNTYASEGLRSVKFVFISPGGGCYPLVLQQHVEYSNLVPGASYKIKFKYRSDFSLSTGTASVGLSDWLMCTGCTGPPGLSYQPIVFNSTAGWQSFTADIQAPTVGLFWYFTIDFCLPGITGSVWVDEVSFVKN